MTDLPEGEGPTDYDEDNNPLDVDTDLLAKAQAAAAAVMDDEEPSYDDDDAEEPEAPDEFPDLDDEDEELVEGDEELPDDDADEDDDDADETPADDDITALRAEKEARVQAAEARKEAAELKAQIAKLKKLAEYDRIELMKELGQDDLVGIGEEFFQGSLGDDADEEFKLQRRKRRAEMEVAELEGYKTKAQQAKEQALVDEFRGNVTKSVKGLDTEAFPAVSKLLEVKGDTEVSERIFQAAVSAAQRTGQVPAIEELLTSLEAEYAPFMPAATDSKPRKAKKSLSESKKKGKGKPKSLRNNMQRSRRPRKQWEDMTPQEQQRYRLARARKVAAEAMKKER